MFVRCVVAWMHSLSNGIREIAVPRHPDAAEAALHRERRVSNRFPQDRVRLLPSFPFSNPWLLDVLKLCLQRNPKKRPAISSLLQHPFLQPQGEQAMQVFQAAALGNDNMQDVVRQILQTTEDPVWEEEGFVEAVCHELAKQCVESSRVSFLEALERVKNKTRAH